MKKVERTVANNASSFIAVIIPTLNEESNLGLLIKELNCVVENPSLFVVDGRSSDGTVKVAKNLGAEIIYQEGYGKGSALRQAFNHEKIENDFVVMIDADWSMDPKEIPLFIKALESGADIVKGSRLLPNGRSDDFTLIRKIGNRFFVWLVNFIWSTNYTDVCYGFMAFRKSALQTLSKYLESNNFEIELEICIMAKKIGLNMMEIPSIEHKRRKGTSHLNVFRDGVRILFKILKLAFKNT